MSQLLPRLCLGSGLLLSASAAEITAGYDVGSGFDIGKFKVSCHSFETDAEIPAGLSRSDRHTKHGEFSLRWDYRPDRDRFILDDPAGMRQLAARTGGVKIWIYREKPAPGAELLLEFGTPTGLASGKPRSRCRMRQNFTGWRAAWFELRSDAEQPDPKQPLEKMQFRIAGSATPGTLFIDRLELTDSIYWARESDRQVTVNRSRKGGPNQTETVFNTPFPANVPPPSAAELAALPVIEKRLREWLTGSEAARQHPELGKLTAATLDAVPRALKKLDAFDIRRHPDGRITGKPVFNVMHGGRPHIQELFTECILPLAMAWHEPGTPERPNPYYHSPELRQKILLAFDHAHDQGWATGSAMGTAYGLHLGLSGYSLAIFLMRQELAEAGILAREVETNHYVSLFRQMYADRPKAPGFGGADSIRTLALFKLLAIISMDDNAKRAVLLRSFAGQLNSQLTVSRGLNSMIKPDYTLYHHFNVYWNGYGINATDMAARLGYWLRDTPYQLTPASRENLKQALLLARFAAQKYDFPISINGRWPFWADGLVPGITAFGYTAMLYPEPDPKLAAAFLRLYDLNYAPVRQKFRNIVYYGNTFTGTLGNAEDMDRFAALFAGRVKPEKTPQGFRAAPYAGAVFVRRGETLLAVKGNSRYIWDFETKAEGQLGRNLSRGSIFIYSAGNPVSMAASGLNWAGWDFSRIPGATSLHQPPEKIDAELLRDPSRNFTAEVAVGGMAVGDDGLFMMRFADRAYRTGLKFDQSVYCYGNTVLSLGSSLACDDPDYPVETTLFQRRLATPDTQPSTVDGRRLNALPARFDGWPGKLALTDSANLTYVVADGAKVRLQRARQEFPLRKHGNNTGGSGDFESAWIAHGVKPQNGSWEYAILLNGEKTPHPYRVLRQSGDLHAVAFENGPTLATLFAPGPVGIAPVAAVDAPALLGWRQQGDQLTLDAAMPDIGKNWRPIMPKKNWMEENTDFTNAPGAFTITLDGAWTSADPAIAVVRADNRTRLTLPAVDGAAHRVTLTRVK